MSKNQISVVIPAYNEEKTIEKVLSSIFTALKGQMEYEIIIVDDSSKDKTNDKASKILSKIKSKNLKRKLLIRNKRNRGYGGSLKTGILNSKYDIILILDADGQHNPKDISKLYSYIDNYDMVVGSRSSVLKGTDLIRAPGKYFLGKFANFIADRNIPDLNSGFRLIRKELVIKFFNLLPDNFSFTTTITLASLQSNYAVKYLPIKIRRRTEGKSSMNIIKSGMNFVYLILRTGMLFNPKKVFLPIGFILTFLGTFYSAYGVLINFDIPESAIVFILSGILLLFFSLIAEQISYLIKQQQQNTTEMPVLSARNLIIKKFK